MSAEVSEHKLDTTNTSTVVASNPASNKDTVFTLKRWNLVAVWSWDVECDVCAICRTFLIGIFFFKFI